MKTVADNAVEDITLFEKISGLHVEKKLRAIYIQQLFMYIDTINS